MTSDNDITRSELGRKIDMLALCIDKLEKKIDKLDDKLDYKIEKIEDKCDECKTEVYKNVNSKLSARIFMWVIGIIVSGIMIQAAYSGAINVRSIQNQTNIQSIEKSNGVKK